MSVAVHSWYRTLFLLIVSCSGGILLLVYRNITDHFIFNTNNIADFHRGDVGGKREMAYEIQTEGCSIPALQPFDEDVIKVMKAPFKFRPCPKRKPLVDKNNTHIWIITENLQRYFSLINSTADVNLTCCYQSFNRPVMVDDITAFKIDYRVQYQPCFNFSTVTEVNPKDEFVRITCFVGKKRVYRNLFLFAPKKKFISHESIEIKQNNSVYNVILLGLDSVSRQHFHRAMPKTFKFVKKLGAIELQGYNKLGDNTFPNLVPMLLGIKEVELKKTCYPHSKSTFDNCPFVWEWFKQAGYYTALAEDTALGIFNYLKRGFIGAPTDYYIRPFMHEAKRQENNHNVNIYNKCLQEKYSYEILLEYFRNLIISIGSSKLFGLFWESDLSHDNLQDTTTLDKHYEKLFRRLTTSNYLNQTVLFLISDHGLRFGSISRTQRGRLEARLPFVYVLLPQSFREKYSAAYSNLKLNSQRLTTPLDMHATLSDLINLKNIMDENIVLRSKTYYSNERSISLFLPIPGNRTCKTADIDDNWCTCHKGKQISVVSTKVFEVSNFLINHLNDLLSFYKQCARLSINKIIEAVEMTTRYARDKLLLIVVETSPGEGIFEATLRRNSGKWVLAGTVGRLNRYGEQSRCVDVYHLKLYCYCI